MIDERLYPVGSYWLGYKRNLNPEILFGFGKWEMQDARSPDGKYIYKRVD